MEKATRSCSVDDCERRHQARGLCQVHYSKATRAGTLGATVRPASSRTKLLRCEQCGETREAPRRNTRFCSMLCRDSWRVNTGTNPMPPPRSDLQRALVDEDWPALLDAIVGESTVRPNGCWEWKSHEARGYAFVRVRGRRHAVHRLAMMAELRGRLDSSMPVHHKCAVRHCVNPAHLQVVTPQENTAEMFERKFYRERIASLEAALAEVVPGHPLLA